MNKDSNNDNFYIEVISQKKVWTIKDCSGFPAPVNSSGKRAMPFWSRKSLVEEIISKNSDYNNFEPYEISLSEFLNKWLIGLKKDEILVGVNWSGKNVSGYDLTPEEVSQYIKNITK